MSTAAVGSAVFTPVSDLVPGVVHTGCRACVTIPARNEETTLPACLDALAHQYAASGQLLPPEEYEVLLLLNNCTDRSAEVVRAWQARHPALTLHVIEQILPDEKAHAGWARRLLMDTAWRRLGGRKGGAILATDADSVVAPDWIASNLAAIDGGADAVGGAICIRDQSLQSLPAQVRTCYRRDRRYAELVARLEAILDPQTGDPWPRHADHFGSSLACTAEAYALAGGIPAVSPLEDEAFVDALRRANLCLRHDPAVRVYTSARLEGRAPVGLAGQLRLWNELAGEDSHTVQAAAYLAHRFTILARLREAFATSSLAPLSELDAGWKSSVRTALHREDTVPAFFTAIDCNGLIDATFRGLVEEPITKAITALEDRIAQLTAEPVKRHGYSGAARSACTSAGVRR